MAISGPEILLYEKRDRIVIITLNRPERMNALSRELVGRLNEAWEQFRDDDDAWVAILTGMGDKAFSVGADVREFKETGNNPGQERESELPLNADVWKPVIAAINGYATAGGWLLAQRCDIRIAAEHAKMGISEARLNLPAGFVSDLTRQLHLGHALEIVLWCDQLISAQRGYEIGWINRVVPKERLMEEAMSWAERILYIGPRAVRNLKEILYRGFYMTPEAGRDFSAKLLENIWSMEDTAEGIKAFREHRKPNFKNR